MTIVYLPMSKKCYDDETAMAVYDEDGEFIVALTESGTWIHTHEQDGSIVFDEIVDEDKAADAVVEHGLYESELFRNLPDEFIAKVKQKLGGEL